MRAESKVVSEGKLKLDAVVPGIIYGACFGTRLFCANFTHNLLRKMTHSHPDLMNDTLNIRDNNPKTRVCGCRERSLNN